MGSNRSGTGTGGTTTKVSFSLNSDVLAELKYVADTVNISRSAFLSMLLAESLPTLRLAADALKKSGDMNDALDVAQRFSDSASDELNSRIRALKGSNDGKMPS